MKLDFMKQRIFEIACLAVEFTTSNLVDASSHGQTKGQAKAES